MTMAAERVDVLIGPGGEEIAFFDVETTVPVRTGQGFALLEFGAILVCPRKLEEKWSFSTLIRPIDLSLISSLSVRCNGITRDLVLSAPPFSQIADTVFNILHGRIWAGHNITRFDCARIREAFAEIGRPCPEPKGIIDSLAILTQRFGRRAGDMKMATLATYFNLGKQTHRSLDDVRMNLEVLKYCATVLFLESSLPEAFPDKSWVSPNAVTRSRKNGKSSPESADTNIDAPSSSTHPIFSLVTKEDPFEMKNLGDELNTETLPTIENQEVADPTPSDTIQYVSPEDVSVASISASHVPRVRGTQRLVILHKGVSMQLRCPCLEVRFGISSKFTNSFGRPKLSFVVKGTPSICKALDTCDDVARDAYVEYGGTSDWRKVVSRKDGFVNFPTVRLNLPSNEDDVVICVCGSGERLTWENLDGFIVPGVLVDVDFSLDFYDFQQNAGLRLVARKIVVPRN